MKIGIIGAGAMGSGLATLLARAGHSILLSSRNPSRVAQTLRPTDRDVRAASVYEAAAADVVVLAVPFERVDDVIAVVGSLSGRIVIDVTNGSPALRTISGMSAALQLARRMPDALLVKAFSHIPGTALTPGRQHCDGLPLAAYYCGDHAIANARVAELISDTGFAPVCAGSLASACAIERGGVLERRGLRIVAQARELVEMYIAASSSNAPRGMERRIQTADRARKRTITAA